MIDVATPEAPVASPIVKKAKKKSTPLAEAVVFIGDDKTVGLTSQRSAVMGYVCDENGEFIYRRDPVSQTDNPIIKEYKFPHVCKTQEELDEFENVMANQLPREMDNSIKRLDGIDAQYYLKHHQQVDLYSSSSAARAASATKRK